MLKNNNGELTKALTKKMISGILIIFVRAEGSILLTRIFEPVVLVKRNATSAVL